MRTDVHTANESVATTVVRKAYSSPELRCFGAVGALTQSGTGAVSELNPNNGRCSNAKTKQRC